MINEGMKNLAAGANPIILRKGMKKATEAAVEAITEKILKAQNENSVNLKDATILKQADSFLIKSLGNVINITIDKAKLTGK
jgi:chaperonin GroEL (HSP60 family)